VSDTTYGELLAEAERQLVRAIFATHEPFRTVPQARHAADDYAHLLLALKAGFGRWRPSRRQRNQESSRGLNP
jgi:hypothetical protein